LPYLLQKHLKNHTIKDLYESEKQSFAAWAPAYWQAIATNIKKSN